MQLQDVTNPMLERESIEAEIRGETLLSALYHCSDRMPDGEALRWKEGNRWLSLTWRQYSEAVREVAAGLRSIGFQANEFALILSSNRPECLISELGVSAAGGTPVVLYNTLPAEQIEYIANHCSATIALVEDETFLGRFEAVSERLGRVRHVVTFEPTNGRRFPTLTLNTLRARGRGDLDSGLPLPERTASDVAIAMYTSGTTGPPKAVIQTHGAALFCVAAMRRLLPLETLGPGLSYLPLAHVGAQTMDCWVPVVTGIPVAFCPDPAQLQTFLAEVRPGSLFGVPRVWEKLQAGIRAALLAERDPVRRDAVERAIQSGMGAVRLRQRGEPVPPATAEAAALAEKVGQAIREKIGLDRVMLGVSAGAPIDPAVVDFFRALGVPMIEAWGMTEVIVGTSSSAATARSGAVGKAIPGIELRVAEDGELLLRGPIVMKGYYRDHEQTAQAIDADGWLHTGDVATIDDEGYVRIVDRKKELIITAGGKNLSPVNVEYLLTTAHPLIGQACVIGDRRRFVTALLVLDPEMAPIWAERNGIQSASLADFVRHPRLIEEVSAAVAAANQHLARVEQVKRFRLITDEWTPQTGELTPTLKLRRRAVAQRYGDEIESLYREGLAPGVCQPAPAR